MAHHRLLLPTLVALILHLLLRPAYAVELIIKIPSSQSLPNPNTLPPSTHATLTSSSGKPLDAILRKDNTIHFPNIQTTGSHLLKIYTTDYVFAPYRIDVAQLSPDQTETIITGAYETYPGTQWSDHGVPLLPNTNDPVPPGGGSVPASQSTTTSGQAGVTSLTIHPKLLARKNFYEDRPTFSPLTLLKNPMILMGGVALLFTFGMPKLMENMDPEMKAEYEEMQKKSPLQGMTRAVQQAQSGGGISGGDNGFDLAGYLAGKSSTGTSGAAPAGGAENLRERRR